MKTHLGGVVPFGPVQDVADIFADPHVRARAHARRHRASRPRTSRTHRGYADQDDGNARAAFVDARRCLANTPSEILAELGYSADAIESLKRNGAIS